MDWPEAGGASGDGASGDGADGDGADGDGAGGVTPGAGSGWIATGGLGAVLRIRLPGMTGETRWNGMLAGSAGAAILGPGVFPAGGTGGTGSAFVPAISGAAVSGPVVPAGVVSAGVVSGGGGGGAIPGAGGGCRPGGRTGMTPSGG